ncbi:GGDEF domain-containing protein [Massilia sp. S19_KUP03_FR1]|uniref:GGDEF domain-containing protein n=1 Tax=Massilia sp. S19_KUP03_FR1 TaxID=3025503 RepID=UPI002FCD867A
MVIFFVLLAAALVAYVSLHLAERQMRAVVGDQQVSLLSSVASYIDEDLSSKKTLMASMGEQLSLGDYSAPLAIQQFFEAHHSLRDEFFNMIALDATGNLIANLNDRRAIGGSNFGKREYFLDTVANREGVISAPFQSSLSKKAVVVITEPVFNASGKLIYIILGAIDLQTPRFFGQLETLKSGKSGYLFMLTKQGIIIHHPDQQRILMNVKQEVGGAVPSTLAAMNGFEGWVEGSSKKGVKSLITYKRLFRTDWILGAVYPMDEAFAPLIDMRGKALLASGFVAIAAGLLGWLAIMRLLLPLGALRQHVANISGGSINIEVFDVDRRDEFGELSRAFFLLSQQRRGAENELVRLTHTDTLTGLYNRRMFEETMVIALARARRNKQHLALAYLDIDHFKHINDSYGHGVGDQVLIEFARRLKLAVRVTDTVVRLAGDEFVVIFENLQDDTANSELARKILVTIEPTFVLGELSFAVTTSIGIAANANGSCSVAALMEASDSALYEAKRAGRNGFALRSVPDTLSLS